MKQSTHTIKLRLLALAVLAAFVAQDAAFAAPDAGLQTPDSRCPV